MQVTSQPFQIGWIDVEVPEGRYAAEKSANGYVLVDRSKRSRTTSRSVSRGFERPAIVDRNRRRRSNEPTLPGRWRGYVQARDSLASRRP